MNRIKKNKQPWPTKKAMEQVYEMRLWGSSNECEFYSGEGSHDPKIIDPYIKTVTAFLNSFSSPISVVDLGCGDFNIGKKLLPFSLQYIAVDIVPNLIEHNKKEFKDDNLMFCCLDISKDNLPKGDCAILRQVLQHLSNEEVTSVLKKLDCYNYVILTEHIPCGDFVPNKNIISGQGIRIKKQSGLDVLAAPFYFKVESSRVLSSIKLIHHSGKIVTTLYKIYA